ncbi:MAG: RND transporter [Pseudomonadota bacterium]
MKWLDQLPLALLLPLAVLLALAPFSPEPHLVEKLRMLRAGALVRPLDIFDLFLHGAPLLLVVAILARRSGRRH